MNKKEKKPTDKLADKTALTKFLQGIFGDAQKKTLKRMWKKAQEINKLEPKYEEMCRRFLADSEDFSEDKILQAGVANEERFLNDDLDKCLEEEFDLIILDLMLPGVDTDDACVWDMQDVSELPSMFLNMSLGRFVKDRGADFVKKKVRFKNINKSQALRIVEYVEKISK